MKNKIKENFRFKIMFYSIVSMLIAVLVDAILVGVIYFGAYTFLPPTDKHREKVVNTTEVMEQSNVQLKNEAEMESALNQSSKSRSWKDEPMYRAIFIFSGILAAVVGVSVFGMLFQMFTKRLAFYLREISDGIDELSLGNLHKEIPIKGEDEFANIAEKLNVMTGEIRMLLENERQYEREKDALITNVAHDLRTPLTSVIGYLDLVRIKEDLTREQQIEYIGVAYDKAKRLEKLIEDLFEFTKVGAERTKVQLMEIDFRRFIEQMVEEFYPSLESVKLECKVEMNVERGTLMADGNLLARGISNLFSNAVKYGRDGKVLKVKVNEDIARNEMKLEIVNYGEIISEEDIEHIFDKFFRGESSRSTETGGSGLGLAIAKKVVLLHHGQIAVSSDYNGTVFSITLPIEQSEEEEDEEQN